MDTSYCAGIDVSKLNLDVHILPNDHARRLANNAQGHRQLVKLLKDYGANLVVLESSGGYESAAVVALVNAGLRVHVAQPLVVRGYAVSLGLKAKTDKIDARVLARFAKERGKDLRVIDKIDKTHESLQALIVRRDQLVGMQTMELNRSQQTTDKAALKSVNRLLAWLEREIVKIEKTIDGMIKADAALNARSEKLREIKGVGPQTARLLVACLPELGKSTPKQLNALVGVAPYPQESGEHKGPSRICGGRKLVRNGLYMSCLSMMQSNPVIASYHRQLTGRGLAFKTVMMACIRKILAYMDSLIRPLEQQAAA